MQQTISSYGARLYLGELPTAGDTVSIGADTYEFLASATAPVAGNIKVLLNDYPIQNLVQAINLRGTELVVAQDMYPLLWLRPAATIGGTPVITYPDIALASGLTPAADVWDFANLNLALGLPTAYPSVPQYVFTVGGYGPITLSGSFFANAGADPVKPGTPTFKIVLYGPDGTELGQENMLTDTATVTPGLYSRAIDYLLERTGQPVAAGATGIELYIDSGIVAASSIRISAYDAGADAAAHPGHLELTVVKWS